MVDKFETNARGAMLLLNLIQVTESISGSVVPLAMFNIWQIVSWKWLENQRRALSRQHSGESIWILITIGPGVPGPAKSSPEIKHVTLHVPVWARFVIEFYNTWGKRGSGWCVPHRRYPKRSCATLTQTVNLKCMEDYDKDDFHMNVLYLYVCNQCRSAKREHE